MKIYHSDSANCFLKENRYNFSEPTGLLYLHDDDDSREDFICNVSVFFNSFHVKYISIIDDDEYLFLINQKLKDYKRSLGKAGLLKLRENVIIKKDFKHKEINYYLDVIEKKGEITQDLFVNIFDAILCEKKTIFMELSDCIHVDVNSLQVGCLNGFLTINKNKDVFRVLFANNISGRSSVVIFGRKESIQNLIFTKIGEREIIKNDIPKEQRFGTICLLPVPCVYRTFADLQAKMGDDFSDKV
jgi:hypothetical protein